MTPSKSDLPPSIRVYSLAHFLRPTASVATFPLLLVALAVAPILILRYTLYSLLALPLWPIIQRLGWVYRDKPMFLTPKAAILASVVWAIIFYLLFCLTRYLRASRAARTRNEP